MWQIFFYSLLAVAGDRSALLSLGRAALLGYVSKDPSACIDSYSRCPKDPDRLVQYLNNYNGGFFRFFSGHNLPQVQKRILTGTSKTRYTQNEIHSKKGKTLKFPVATEYLEEDLNYPKAPSDHVRLPVIFPDRTGTGEFRFDADEFKADTNTFENNNVIREYVGNEHNFRDFNKHKYNTMFSFPLGDFWIVISLHLTLGRVANRYLFYFSIIAVSEITYLLLLVLPL